MGPSMIPVLTQSGVIDEYGWMLGEEMKVGKFEDTSTLGEYKKEYVSWPGSSFYHYHSFAHHRGELYRDISQNLLVCSDDSDPIDLTCGNEEVKLEPGDTYSGEVHWLHAVFPKGQGTLSKKNGTVHEGEFRTKEKAQRQRQGKGKSKCTLQ